VFSDTSREAARIQADIHRALGESGRLRRALEMSLTVRELAAARVRQEHPDWSDADVRRELLRYAFAPAPLPPELG
jgi:hypothetical protein